MGDDVNGLPGAFVTTDACVSDDGSALFFSSDRPGGFGGYDLWASQWDNDGWTTPQNLGPAINTDRDERGPFVAADGGTMYFSSNRLDGMGNDDIWSTWRDGSGIWSPPRNLGPDVNSSGDDRDPALSPDGQTLYFSALRTGGNGLFDIWSAHRSCHAFDTTLDGQVDPLDWSVLHGCVESGIDAAECADVDADANGRLDLLDFRRFQICAGSIP